MPFLKVRLLLLVIVLFQSYDEGYVFQCPFPAQWNIRATKICNVTEKYHCLLDDNYNKFIEFCKDSYNIEKPGHKLIVVGSLQREICPTNRYQPIQFRSNGSSDCIFSKSLCNEEGQLIFNNGTNVGDRGCRCDYTKGYNFVNTPKTACFMIPSEEDCSCYFKQCDAEQILTPDYICVYPSEWKPPFSCLISTFFQSSGREQPDQEKVSLTFTTTENVLELQLWHDYRLDCASVLCPVISVFAVIGIFVLLLQDHLIKKVSMKDIQFPTDMWKNKLAYFIPTTASENIFNDVKLHQCTLITGPPGCGKTAIAYNIAFELQKSDKYSVETVTMPGEVFKLNSSIKNRKHVFIIDDVIGKNTICNYDVVAIRNAIKSVLIRNSRIKIIMTCRSHIYKMNDFCETVFHQCDMLSISMQLSVNERRTMIEGYLGEKVQIADDVLVLYNFFPSLCDLAIKEKEHLATFLTYPIAYLDNEISTVRGNSDVLYLALAILVVKGNYIEKSLFNMQNKGGDSILQDIFYESGFQQLPKHCLLKTTLESLPGTYLSETKISFSMLNPILFDIISSIVGKSFISSILKHGNITFINRLQLASLKTELFQPFNILVSTEFEDDYFARKLRDIKNGNIWDSLYSKQMDFPEYSAKLCICLERHQIEIKQARDIKDGSSVLHVIADYGYKYLLPNLVENNRSDLINNENKNRTYLNPNNETATLPLFCKANINSQDFTGRTPLHVACSHDFIDIVNVLIKNGSIINKTDKKGLTPLHLATTGGHFQSVKLLIDKHADINCQDIFEKTPLILACEKHDETIIRMLLDHDQKSRKYLSTLKNVFFRGNEDVVTELVKLDTNLDIIFSDGSTPLHTACKAKNMNIVQILLASKADINIKNNNGLTPLFQSCDECQHELVGLLLGHSADTNCTNKAKRTPLHVACMKGFNDIAKVLINSNADVNARDANGCTPLFFSCSQGNKDLVQHLITHGADINIRDKKLILPLEVAFEKGFSEVVEILKGLRS